MWSGNALEQATGILAEEKADMDGREARRISRLDGSINKSVQGKNISHVSSVKSIDDVTVSKVQLEIIGEMAETLSMLGASSGLMACIGSWGDTLPQDEVLEMWRDWNQLAKQKGWIVKPAVFV